ncbi:MAG TPA: hypothetical protein DIT67_12915 [Octadecabacter sp.]|nr:hypothetical protein [Octadecabacter sp.]
MIRFLILAGLLTASTPALSQTSCRQALALGLDVSGSVDSQEYRLQLDGLALALGDPEVVEALVAQPSAPVVIAVYEWSAPGDERLVLDWRPIANLSDIREIQAILHTTQRANMGPSTGLGSALERGFALLEQRPECWTRTLDISGDGKGNTGRRPQDVSNTPNGVTVNGLVIGVDDDRTGNSRNLQIAELASYYTAYVIRGPNAFVETALGFEAYQDAMTRKLLRELQTIAIGQLSPSH